MANLAIKGHTTRGEEVIEILEMLGGKNKVGLLGKNETLVYFIKNGVIYNTGMNLQTLPFKTFTLEEFLKKFPYKVGDKVCFPDDLSTPFTINKMWWDENANELLCSFIEDDIEVPVVGIRTYKEKSIDKTNKVIFEANAQCCDIMNDIIKYNIEKRKYAELRLYPDQDDKLSTEVTCDDFKITAPDSYLIGKVTKVDNGMLVEYVKKPSDYPDTYEECCSVLGMKYYYPDIRKVSIEESNRYSSFVKLIRCRDAYWRIAGKWMGLGKPWEPTTEIVYCISRSDNVIKCSYRGGKSNVLEFPTEEMRDAFYENFKELIEACKELL